MGRIPAAAKRKAALWLSQGITPLRLALTLALGFAIGCIPVIGIPTVLCAGLALALRLNLPAIQAANYAAMPLQLALIVPFVRLGRWIVLRTFRAVGDAARAGAFFRSQSCQKYERTSRRGSSGVAYCCDSGGLADDGCVQPDAAPHSDSEKRRSRRLSRLQRVFARRHDELSVDTQVAVPNRR